MKQHRRLKRTTLLVIREFLVSTQPLTSAEVIQATGVAAIEVRQILKRLRYWGWLAGETKQSAGAAVRRWRHRLTTTGRRDAPKALAKQATWTETGGWQLHEEEAAPASAARPQQVRTRRAREYYPLKPHSRVARPPLREEVYQWSRS